MRRVPAVAGQFYHSSGDKLKGQVAQYASPDLVKEHAIAILAPHAGLIYSGPVAGEVYSRLVFPKTFILIGPNHTGLGSRISLMSSGEWEIPTGIFTIDEDLSGRILRNAPIVAQDPQAHIFEHSLEVQLPFIGFFSSNPQIVPITMMAVSLSECEVLGEAIAKSVRAVGYPVVIVASSDMSHYVSDDTARHKDMIAVDRIKGLDPAGLYHTVLRYDITMCGFIPAVVMLYAAKSLGAYEAKLVKYSTSAEVSGDYDRVVGYAGMIIK